jgi:DNA-binding MarR family transcriptional regulator
MTSIWPEFGYRESLYATAPVPATAEGENLLVGRTSELRELKTLLASTSLHPTIEGENGVGKTSLVAVAGYQLMKSFQNGHTSQALLPLGRVFQLTPRQSVDSFRRQVLLETAQGLIDNFDVLKAGGLDVPDVNELRRWLSRAIQQRGGGGRTESSSDRAGRGAAGNSGSGGFSESGFSTVVEAWLRQTFPSTQSGGFICVIDNLELLETYQTARTLLEGLRDEVLGLPGLRWVLCGARGIVQTGASSARLEGRLAEPMLLGPLPHAKAPDVVSTRREAYRVRDDAVAPVGRKSFRLLYDVLNGNLRNALKYAENFSLWLALNSQGPWISETNDKLLEVWLSETADKHLAETKLGGAAWKVFERLIEMGGSCSPSDFEQFGYTTPMALRPQIKALEDVNLIVSSIDETDKRRKTISVAPRGWLVQFARSGYALRSLEDGQVGK